MLMTSKSVALSPEMFEGLLNGTFAPILSAIAIISSLSDEK